MCRMRWGLQTAENLEGRRWTGGSKGAWKLWLMQCQLYYKLKSTAALAGSPPFIRTSSHCPGSNTHVSLWHWCGFVEKCIQGFYLTAEGCHQE